MVTMTSFADLGLPVNLAHQLRKQNIHSPFPIQQIAIPDALAGLDILGRAPTGSGKTLAFGLPMISRFSSGGISQPHKPRGVIIVPTRELATQIKDRLETLAHPVGLRVLDIVGGVNLHHQLRLLAAPVDILVATPGRALELLDLKQLNFSHVQMMVLDEADHMADLGFIPQVVKLLNKTPRNSQRLFFSATLDGEVKNLVAKYMTNPVTHFTAEVTAAVDTMAHYCFFVGDKRNRNNVVAYIANRPGKTIMFMRTKHGVDRQVQKLRRVGVNAVGLHGDKGQATRTAVISAFSSGKVPVLVATDIAARGIDISEVDLVVHIDPPAEPKAYLHRAGRTARAGANGKVITLVLDDQVSEVDRLLADAGVTAQQVVITPQSAELVELTKAVPPTRIPLKPLRFLQQSDQQTKSRATEVGTAGKPGQRGRRRNVNKKSAWGGKPKISAHGSHHGRNRKARGR